MVPHLARYPWADTGLIGGWLGRTVEPPVAEAWFGTHPAGPTRIGDTAGGTAGDSAGDAVGLTLAGVLAGTVAGGELAWLVKLLAAAEPLSLQVHPDAATAAAGFAANRPGFVDGAAKPEVLVAFVPTLVLAGFDRRAAVADRMWRLGGSTLTALVDRSTGQRTGEVARQLWTDAALAAVCAAEIAAAYAAAGPRTGRDGGVDDALALVVRRWGAHPSVAVAACLEPLLLAPGQMLAVRPGLVHAYLYGGGLEVMGSSDNVFRGGLTDKPVDTDTLLQVADLDASADVSDVFTDAAAASDARRSRSSWVEHPAGLLPCPLRRLTLRPGSPLQLTGPALMWVQTGTVTVTAAADRSVLAAGTAGFVTADAGTVAVTGDDDAICWTVDGTVTGASATMSGGRDERR